MPHVTATFKSRESAEAALRQLEAIGVAPSQVSLVMTDQARGSFFKMKESSKVDEGTAAGAALGGLAGAVLAILTSAGAVAIPGLNIVVAGTLISGLAGLGAGAATGGLLGALIGAGIPEHEAKLYEKEVKSGSILLAVKATDNDQKQSIKEILNSTDAYNVAA